MTAAASAPDKPSLARRLYKFGQRAALVFVRYSAQTGSAVPIEGSVCYVLERDQLFDKLVLRDLCLKEGWPRAGAKLADGAGALWSVRTFTGWLVRHLVPSGTDRLSRAIAWLEAHPDKKAELYSYMYWSLEGLGLQETDQALAIQSAYIDAGGD